MNAISRLLMEIYHVRAELQEMVSIVLVGIPVQLPTRQEFLVLTFMLHSKPRVENSLSSRS